MMPPRSTPLTWELKVENWKWKKNLCLTALKVHCNAIFLVLTQQSFLWPDCISRPSVRTVGYSSLLTLLPAAAEALTAAMAKAATRQK